MMMSDTRRTVIDTRPENGLHPSTPEGIFYPTATTTHTTVSEPTIPIKGHRPSADNTSSTGSPPHKLMISVGSDKDSNHLLQSASCTGQGTALPSHYSIDSQGLTEPGGESCVAGSEQGTTTIVAYPPSDRASDTKVVYSSTVTVIFSLDNISSSPYYTELTDIATTRNISLFGTVCRHRIGERVACLLDRLGNLSTHNEREDGVGSHYDVGRVLYLTMLWEEGVKYIENLTNTQVEEEYQFIRTLPSLSQKATAFKVPAIPTTTNNTDSDSVQTSPKDQLMLWLKVIAQGAVDHVVSTLTTSSLDVLNTLAGDDEDLVIIHAT